MCMYMYMYVQHRQPRRHHQPQLKELPLQVGVFIIIILYIYIYIHIYILTSMIMWLCDYLIIWLIWVNNWHMVIIINVFSSYTVFATVFLCLGIIPSSTRDRLSFVQLSSVSCPPSLLHLYAASWTTLRLEVLKPRTSRGSVTRASILVFILMLINASLRDC